ncbi:anthrone oxygenase family protein [Nocardia sp. NPDC051832]|uniref:anthrone oxygenase family protein n=1 Tax=Nocardia sp. NPDC051832 TaxID=3155673 RepID=UPI003412E48A
MRTRLIQAVAVLSTGLLAGAFGYGLANLAPTFHRVPLQMRLEFHTALMKANSISMQLTMAAAALSCLGLAVLRTGRARRMAGAAAALVVASFGITRLGNVPINHQINRWVTAGAPENYAEILTRWDIFHALRTSTALVAFGLMIALALWSARSGKEALGASAETRTPAHA